MPARPTTRPGSTPSSRGGGQLRTRTGVGRCAVGTPTSGSVPRSAGRSARRARRGSPSRPVAAAYRPCSSPAPDPPACGTSGSTAACRAVLAHHTRGTVVRQGLADAAEAPFDVLHQRPWVPRLGRRTVRRVGPHLRGGGGDQRVTYDGCIVPGPGVATSVSLLGTAPRPSTGRRRRTGPGWVGAGPDAHPRSRPGSSDTHADSLCSAVRTYPIRRACRSGSHQDGSPRGPRGDPFAPSARSWIQRRSESHGDE